MQVTIIGKPNVGKSSLMNALLRETRAIVTEIPGTTRDTIEEGVSVRGIPIRLTDTAGIRQTEDVIEKIGIEKSKESFNRADLVIFMIDRSQPLDEEDYEIIRHLDGKKSIVILNKTDLPPVVSDEEARALLPEAVLIEAAVGQSIGITELEDAIEKFGLRRQSETAGQCSCQQCAPYRAARGSAARWMTQSAWRSLCSRSSFWKLTSITLTSCSAKLSARLSVTIL